MCVIIDKLPGHELPFGMLISSAARNPDGWGIIIDQGNGSLEVRKGLTKPGYAADAVARALEEAKDLRALVHFRYKTIGERSVENAHPFQVLDKATHGVDLHLMHNGTIHDFGDYQSGESDTAQLVQQIVKPLSTYVMKVVGHENILDDPLFEEILKRYAGKTSKFSLIDSNGEVLHINRSFGKTFDWGWASNEYSLLAKDSVTDQDWKDAGRDPPHKAVYKGASFTPLSERLPQGRNDTVARVIQNAANNNKQDAIADYAPKDRVDICKVLGIGELDELFCLDVEQYRQIVKQEPECAVLLLIEYAYALYQLKSEMN